MGSAQCCRAGMPDLLFVRFGLLGVEKKLVALQGAGIFGVPLAQGVASPLSLRGFALGYVQVAPSGRKGASRRYAPTTIYSLV